jgi:DNA-binding cell septation regulator SpoVG
MEAHFYAPRTKGGKIVAFADVQVDEGMFVKGFRIIDGNNGRFAAVPSRPVTVNGQTRYWNQISFSSKARRERFLGELLEAYDDWVESGAKDTRPQHGNGNGAADSLDADGEPAF